MEKVLQHMKEHWRSYLPLVLALFGLVIYFLLFHQGKEAPVFTYEQSYEEMPHDQHASESTQDALPEEDEKVVVDVKGAVKDPGVYTMEEGDRLIDAVRKAGGLTSEANDASLNYALRLEDEMVVYVPTIGEEVDEEFSESASDSSSDVVNINKATEEELMTIPGIGPAKAAAIIDHREKEGKFQTKEDIMQVSGIGEKTFENIADLIDVK